MLGDAARDDVPNGSNGGSQATLDARTLAYQLRHPADGRGGPDRRMSKPAVH